MRRTLLTAAVILCSAGARADDFDICAMLANPGKRVAFVDCIEGWANPAPSPAMSDAMTSFRHGDYALAVHQFEVVSRTLSSGNADEQTTARAAAVIARKLAPCRDAEE